MSAPKPVRLLRSALTGRVYVVTDYDEKPGGLFVAKTKHDVTDDFNYLTWVGDLSLDACPTCLSLRDVRDPLCHDPWHDDQPTTEKETP